VSNKQLMTMPRRICRLLFSLRLFVFLRAGAGPARLNPLGHDQFHRHPSRELGDAAGPVNHSSVFLGIGVFLNIVAQVSNADRFAGRGRL